MEIIRHINGVSVSESELTNIKTVTPEITEAVNEVRRRAENGVISPTSENAHG